MRKMSLFIAVILYGSAFNSFSAEQASVMPVAFDVAVTSRYYVNRSSALDSRFSKGFKGEVKASQQRDEQSFSGRIFVNWDTEDNQRRYIDVREASFYYQHEKLRFGLGVDTFFWGVAESINLVNVLNQSDVMESIDGKVKLGQPFLSLNQRYDDGDFSVYFLPIFREQNFPLRPNYGLPIAEQPLYEDGRRRGGIAMRRLFYFDQGEFALSYFAGTRRSPLLVQSQLNPQELTPYYVQTQNAMLDGVYLFENFTLKLELKVGDEQNSNFTAFNFGVEYPIYDLFEGIEEITLISEFLFDDRDAQGENHGQNDLFIGTKFDFGHSYSSRVRVLYSYDFDFKSQYAEVNYEYRINDYFRLKSKFIKVLSAPVEDTRLYALKDEQYLKLDLHYAF